MEEILTDRGVTVVVLDRNYDASDESSMARIDGLLRDKAENAQPPLLLLDMSRTTTINSSFIGLLFAAGKLLRARNGVMALCAADAFCADVFRIVKLGEMFKSYPTRAEAITALTDPQITN